jgi:putative Mg2+ transporter-C (MgtC) family protein
MPPQPAWSDIALRLLCTVIAGGLFGLDRSERGRVAGLRTTILISLAACLSMIEVNLLISLSGKAPDSYVVLDLMRLPLGILSGMGFIGAGAIVRRDQFVVGVTTAATLWFVTVTCLCFGGGQIALGIVGSALGIAVLSGLKRIEERLRQNHEVSLLVVSDTAGPSEAAIRHLCEEAKFKIVSCSLSTDPGARSRELKFRLLWRAEAAITSTPDVVYRLADLPGVIRLSWEPPAR